MSSLTYCILQFAMISSNLYLNINNIKRKLLCIFNDVVTQPGEGLVVMGSIRVGGISSS